MPEEGKTDSESSCSFFGKRKAITRKNALCLRRKRTRKAVVSSSKKKSGYPKECITFAENIPRTPSTGHPVSCVFWDSSLSRASGRIRMTKNKSFICRARGRIRMTRIYHIILSFWPNNPDGLRKNLKMIRLVNNTGCKYVLRSFAGRATKQGSGWQDMFAVNTILFHKNLPL